MSENAEDLGTEQNTKHSIWHNTLKKGQELLLQLYLLLFSHLP
jgi:hypothetical protein